MTMSTASVHDVLVNHICRVRRIQGRGRMRICGFKFAKPVTLQDPLMDVSMAAFL